MRVSSFLFEIFFAFELHELELIKFFEINNLCLLLTVCVIESKIYFNSIHAERTFDSVQCEQILGIGAIVCV